MKHHSISYREEPEVVNTNPFLEAGSAAGRFVNPFRQSPLYLTPAGREGPGFLFWIKMRRMQAGDYFVVRVDRIHKKK